MKESAIAHVDTILACLKGERPMEDWLASSKLLYAEMGIDRDPLQSLVMSKTAMRDNKYIIKKGGKGWG